MGFTFGVTHLTSSRWARRQRTCSGNSGLRGLEQQNRIGRHAQKFAWGSVILSLTQIVAMVTRRWFVADRKGHKSPVAPCEHLLALRVVTGALSCRFLCPWCVRMRAPDFTILS